MLIRGLSRLEGLLKSVLVCYAGLREGSRHGVPSRSIAQHHTSIFRATATAAFFRLVFCPPEIRANKAATCALRRSMPQAICTSRRRNSIGPCLLIRPCRLIVPDSN